LQRRRLAARVAFAALLVPAAAAHAAAPGGGLATDPCGPGPTTAILIPNTNRVGIVDMHFLGAEGNPVSFFECIGGRALALGRRSSPSGTDTPFYDATTWRCGRRSRQFVATTTLLDGSIVRGAGGVRTVSCARRFALELRRQAARGSRVRVRIADRWGIGEVRLRLCTTPPRGRIACRRVSLVRRSFTVRYLRPAQRGRWRLELRFAGASVRRSLAVGVRPAGASPAVPVVLATGDSTMQGVESFLADELGVTARVKSDVRPGIGFSKADDFGAVASAQVARLRPATTVVSIGANEGFAMTSADGGEHPCCDAGWVAEYARRVRRTMVTYLRAGRGRVFWMTIPAPRDPKRVPTFAAVNEAILRAASGLPRLRVLRMDTLFSPDGFRMTMPYRGKTVRVREEDGIHLNVLGTKIAAREVAAAMRG
jgi:lysophospholipase L1-like esterase